MTSGMTVSTVGSSKPETKVTNTYKGTATALLTSTDNYSTSESKCDICDQLGHITENCLTFKTANVSERRRLLRAKHLCFKCLKPHMSYRCNECCSDCGYNHHYMICPSLEPQLQSVTDRSLPKVQQGGEHTTSFSSMPLKVTGRLTSGRTKIYQPAKTSSYTTVLQTIQVKVKGPDGKKLTAEVIFDSGSDRSYVTSGLVQACRPRCTGQEFLSCSAFGGEGDSSCKLRSIYDLDLVDPQGQTHTLSAAEVYSICAPIQRNSVPQHYLEKFNHLPLAADYSNGSTLTLQILIGLDYYWNFIDHSQTYRVENLVGQLSPFGYILSGRIECSTDNTSHYHQLYCTSNIQNKNWNYHVFKPHLINSRMVGSVNFS